PDDIVAAHLRHLRDESERRRLALERPEQAKQLVDLLLGEARPAVTHVLEPLPAADREDERPEGPRPPALSTGVAGDDELLPAVRLHLEPVARAAARLVARASLLGDDTLEAFLLGGGEELRPIVEGLREKHRPVPAVEQLGELGPPLLEREIDQRPALELENVEDVVDDRAVPLLHRGEARAPLVVECADRSVEDAVRSRHRCRERPRYV